MNTEPLRCTCGHKHENHAIGGRCYVCNCEIFVAVYPADLKRGSRR